MHPFSPQMPPRNDAAYLRNSSRYTDSNEKLPSIVGQGLVSYIHKPFLAYTIMTTKGRKKFYNSFLRPLLLISALLCDVIQQHDKTVVWSH